MSDFWAGYEDAPKIPGWYAVLFWFDAEEGAFPGCAYWDGTKWNRTGVALFGGPALGDQKAAETLAYKNDPDIEQQDW